MNVDEEKIEEEKPWVRTPNRNERTWQSPIIPGCGYPSALVTKRRYSQSCGCLKEIHIRRFTANNAMAPEKEPCSPTQTMTVQAKPLY